jgi:hypothetical protein
MQQENRAGKGITSKEWLFYVVLFGTVLFALLLPAFVYIAYARNNPEVAELINLVLKGAKEEIITELTTEDQPTRQTPTQIPANNTGGDVVYADERYFLTINQSITDVYESNGKKLYFASYPSFCNAGYIYGDYTQFNSQKCYYEGDINSLRALFKGYFTQKQTEVSLAALEDQILDIIKQGAPYTPR